MPTAAARRAAEAEEQRKQEQQQEKLRKSVTKSKASEYNLLSKNELYQSRVRYSNVILEHYTEGFLDVSIEIRPFEPPGFRYLVRIKQTELICCAFGSLLDAKQFLRENRITRWKMYPSVYK